MEYAHSTEKARDTTLDEEIYDSTYIIERHIIESCNNTHQGAPRTVKQTVTSACASDLGDGSHVTCLRKMSDSETGCVAEAYVWTLWAAYRAILFLLMRVLMLHCCGWCVNPFKGRSVNWLHFAIKI